MKIAKRLLVILLFFVYANCGFAQDTLSREQRLQNYYKNLTLLKSFTASMASEGLNVFQPDYSQDGGGLAYQVVTKLKAHLESEANALGLNNKIHDGWYEATVKYSNSNTYTRSTYTLDVEVQNNRVVKIDFGNGGSVHTGYNNSGYTYTGGYLNFENDFAITRVTVTTRSSVLTYDIQID